MRSRHTLEHCQLACMSFEFDRIVRRDVPHQGKLFVLKELIEAHSAHSHIKRGHKWSLCHEQLGSNSGDGLVYHGSDLPLHEFENGSLSPGGSGRPGLNRDAAGRTGSWHVKLITGE
jgi:hypothetical protein